MDIPRPPPTTGVTEGPGGLYSNRRLQGEVHGTFTYCYSGRLTEIKVKDKREGIQEFRGNSGPFVHASVDYLIMFGTKQNKTKQEK